MYINEVNIETRRATTKKKRDSSGKSRSTCIEGEPVKAKFTVPKLVNEKDEIVATWILL